MIIGDEKTFVTLKDLDFILNFPDYYNQKKKKKKGLKYFALGWERLYFELEHTYKIILYSKTPETFGLFSVYNLGLFMIEKSRR